MEVLGEQLGDLLLDSNDGPSLQEVHPDPMEERRQALKAPSYVI